MPRGPSQQPRRGQVVQHPGHVVAAVRLGEEVGDGDVVEGAGERVEAEGVEDGDVGGDLRGRGRRARVATVVKGVKGEAKIMARLK